MLSTRLFDDFLDIQRTALPGVELPYPDLDLGTQPRQRVEMIEQLAAKLLLCSLWQRRSFAKCEFESLNHIYTLSHPPRALNPYPS